MSSQVNRQGGAQRREARVHLAADRAATRAQRAVGQTLAAQELCTKVRPYLRQHHVQTGVVHYGVFNGRRWEGRIYPILREFIHSSE